jgi:4-hydroxybenzoate polyprenyltransferase
LELTRPPAGTPVRDGAPSVRRPRWRAYLLLSRVSNLPTVWSNVLAGTVVASGVAPWSTVVRLAAGVSLLYTAGMFLNDAFDRHSDAIERPDRSIPAGDVRASTVFVSGFALLVSGEVMIALQPRFLEPLAWGMILATAIVYYDYRHKRSALGPLVMGLCRGLVYCVAAAATARMVSPPVVLAALGLTLYVVGLTVVAKRLGPRAGIVIPLLIAGISLFDAGVIALSGGGGGLAVLAAVGFPLTLLLQRIVPGT